MSGITYINEIEIYPIDLDLSFKANSREGTASESFFVLNIFKAIGLAFKNVDNASVNQKNIIIFFVTFLLFSRSG